MLDQSTRSRIRHIFLSPRPNFALMTAADLLGFTLKELKREIEDGAIVAVWTALGERMTREELVAVAMQKWEQSVIEAALGKDAPSVLPEAIRLVELRARVPRYQRDVLRALARREGTWGRCGADAGAGRRCLSVRRGARGCNAGAGHGVGVAGWGGRWGELAVHPGSGTLLNGVDWRGRLKDPAPGLSVAA